MKKSNLMILKEQLQESEGKHVTITRKNRRKKILIKGILAKTYPNMFLVISDKTNEKNAFTYVEVLKKDIQLKFDEKESIMYER